MQESAYSFGHSSTVCGFLLRTARTQQSRTHLALRRRRAGQFTVRCDRVGLLGEQPRPTRSEMADGGGHACEHHDGNFGVVKNCLSAGPRTAQKPVTGGRESSSEMNLSRVEHSRQSRR